MVSQSGALGEAILADATEAGLGVAMFASVGNRVDVTAADLIEYWETDRRIKVILLYLESFGDPSHFVRVARRVARKKPIIAVKSGRSAAGAAAVGSHTGSVAGADLAADSLLTQCGVLRVDSFREMFSLATALLDQPLPRGDRIAVVTNAGGPGILATDALVGCGLQMAELSKSNQTALRRSLPAEASTGNPVDLLASADAKRYRAALRAVLRDRGVDALLVLFVSPVMIDAEAVAEAIVERAAESSRPVLACIMGRQGGDEAQDLLVENGIPVFRYPEDAAGTLRLMVRRWRMLARRPGKLPTFNVRKSAAGRVLKAGARGDGWLMGAEAEAVLAAYGIPFAESRRVRTPAAAVAAAGVLGFPVVLKAEAPGLLHKSDHLAVSIDLHDEEDLFEAAADLVGRLRRRFKGMKLLVQRQAPGRLEVLLGMTRDERYGPLFVLGMGGIEVEALGDIALRIAPLDDRDPAEMIASLRGARLFEAFRGEPAVNSKAAQEGLMRLQQLVRDFPDIEEVEVNPFILGSRGQPSLAVDARLRVRV
ncbi:MAG: acetate--CoA ligase family protein [Thermoanaerobaculia bacterium]